MILSPPIPWRDVPAGAQVLIDGVPRTVIAIDRRGYPWFALTEGAGPMFIRPEVTVQIVIMDEADAVTNLLAAGFTATPIEES